MIEGQPKYIGPSHQLPAPQPDNYPIDVTNEFAQLPKKPSLADVLFSREDRRPYDPFSQFVGQILLGLVNIGYHPNTKLVLGEAPKPPKPQIPEIDQEKLIKLLKQLIQLNNPPHNNKVGLKDLLREMYGDKNYHIKNKLKENDKIINKNKREDLL